jgi:hypothetical protein
MHVLYIGVCAFVLFLLVIVFSDLPRYADSDYPFGIIINVVCSVVKKLLQGTIFLTSQTPLRKLQLTDIQGKPNRTVLAQDVFSAAIKSLKEDAIGELKKNGTPADVDEIRWVLTVPAIWPEDAKLFMRESAKQVK